MTTYFKKIEIILVLSISFVATIALAQAHDPDLIREFLTYNISIVSDVNQSKVDNLNDLRFRVSTCRKNAGLVEDRMTSECSMRNGKIPDRINVRIVSAVKTNARSIECKFAAQYKCAGAKEFFDDSEPQNRRTGYVCQMDRYGHKMPEYPRIYPTEEEGRAVAKAECLNHYPLKSCWTSYATCVETSYSE